MPTELASTCPEVAKQGVQERGVVRHIASIQLLHKDLLALQGLQQGLQLLPGACT